MKFEQRVKVVEVMALDLDPAVVVDVSTPLAEVMGRMCDAKTGCSLVTRDGLLAGIITFNIYKFDISADIGKNFKIMIAGFPKPNSWINAKMFLGYPCLYTCLYGLL